MIEKKLLIKIAYYYYKLELTQNEIALKLNMSRQRVNRLLKRCRDEGVVKIQIIGSTDSYVEQESLLESKYSLKQVVITPEPEAGQYHDVLGAATAEYLTQSLADEKVVGISWGRTMYSMVQNLSELKDSSRDLKVVQLVGNMVASNRDVQPDEVTRMLAVKLGAEAVLLYAPVYMKNKVAKYTLMQEASIKSVFDLMPQCEMMFCSVSGIDNEYEWLDQKVIEKNYIDELKEKNAVGNICLRYYDRDGVCLDAELHRLEIGINGDMIRKIPNVVCTAGGKEKYQAILSALRGGYINTLITDKATADFLVSN